MRGEGRERKEENEFRNIIVPERKRSSIRTVVADVVSIMDWGGHNLFCLFRYSFIGAPALNIQT